jgi:hypothetical protein
MTEARVENVHADRLGARTFLSQAEKFQKDADVTELSAESKSVLLHNAVISGCDAILQVSGLRVGSGDGSHVLRQEAALEQIDQDTDDLLERLDASRSRPLDAYNTVRRSFRGCRYFSHVLNDRQHA